MWTRIQAGIICRLPGVPEHWQDKAHHQFRMKSKERGYHMTYIILDLEWNQPISYQSRTYREVGDKLIFEMIQIGAVKLDYDLNPADSISIPIAPTHYLRIHPRIKRMTGLDSETLAGAPNFREALEQFVAWCGEDYALLTWGIRRSL